MGKRSKSKRFIQQGKDSVSLHDARFPYRSTLEEAAADKGNMKTDASGGSL
ncbi:MULTISPECIES: competence protein [Bacillus]|uniref:competence protein n=1 Tax=Bacillus TaxID=1386 RepID=UPI000D03702F|nr:MULTISPECIES: competence protein [Bacillus]MDG4728966.1 competence protein [Bacillus pumilus]PRR92030.1 competence protein [Bacillus sp. NMCN1]PRS47309.1 competence protein [Bacillus sp. GBSC66]PRS60521.1 competence protein [Bacillus sp. GBSW19]PRS70765.1 competence protein [Bacillus sp. NMTD17]